MEGLLNSMKGRVANCEEYAFFEVLVVRAFGHDLNF